MAGGPIQVVITMLFYVSARYFNLLYQSCLCPWASEGLSLTVI
jgi:hypothetical protein